MIAFILIIIIGTAAGYAFHKWQKRLDEKYKDEPLTEKEKQKLLRWLSMGKWKFALQHGLLSGGIFCAILFVYAFCSGIKNLSFVDTIVIVIIIMIVGATLGVSLGFTIWNGVQETAKKHSLLGQSMDDKAETNADT